jgi:hypothetical protein
MSKCMEIGRVDGLQIKANSYLHDADLMEDYLHNSGLVSRENGRKDSSR